MCCPDSRVPKHVPASLSYKHLCLALFLHRFLPSKRPGCTPLPRSKCKQRQKQKKRDQKLRASLQVRVPGLPGSSYIRYLGTAPVQAQTGADPPRALPPDLHRGSADPARASNARSVLCTALPLLALPLLVTRESGTDALSRVRVPRAALVLPKPSTHLNRRTEGQVSVPKKPERSARGGSSARLFCCSNNWEMCASFRDCPSIAPPTPCRGHMYLVPR